MAAKKDNTIWTILGAVVLVIVVYMVWPKKASAAGSPSGAAGGGASPYGTGGTGATSSNPLSSLLKSLLGKKPGQGGGIGGGSGSAPGVGGGGGGSTGNLFQDLANWVIAGNQNLQSTIGVNTDAGNAASVAGYDSAALDNTSFAYVPMQTLDMSGISSPLDSFYQPQTSPDLQNYQLPYDPTQTLDLSNYYTPIDTSGTDYSGIQTSYDPSLDNFQFGS